MEQNVPTARDMLNFRVVLVEPEIPGNTGAAARLCVATGSELHLVGRLGFQITDAHVKRAGLDYWQYVQLTQHVDWEAFEADSAGRPMFFFSARSERNYFEAEFPPDSCLVFGCETRGLPESLLARRDQCWNIPIHDHRVRSLNLSTSIGIVLYEAIRQNTLGQRGSP